MMFETATAADVAEALKANKPTAPQDENQSPEVQIWREWCAIVRTVAQVYFERTEDLRAFYRACGMPH
jgi:hypothetical protein